MTKMRSYLALLSLIASPALADTCTAYPWTDVSAFNEPAAALALILETAPSLALPLAETAPTLCLNTGPSETHGSFSPDTNTISIAGDLGHGATTIVLIHELRHLDQSWRGICLSPDLSMRANARAVFSLEADAMAITALISWQMREIDDGTTFAALTSMQETSDIAAVFADTMSATSDVAQATAAAFAAWYTSDARRERYYISTCEAYLSQLEAKKRLPGKLAFDPLTLAGVCRLPSGESYPCIEPENALSR